MIDGFTTKPVCEVLKLRDAVEHFFTKRYGKDNIKSCDVIYDLQKFSKLIEQKRNYEKILNQFKNDPQMRPMHKKHWYSLRKTVDSILYFEEQLEILDDKISGLLKQGLKCTGVAIITFTNSMAAEKCLQDFDPDMYTMAMILEKPVCLSATSMRVERKDTIWENLEYTIFNRIARMIAVIVAVPLCMTIFVFCMLYLSELKLFIYPLIISMGGSTFIPNSISYYITYSIPIILPIINFIISLIMKGLNSQI